VRACGQNKAHASDEQTYRELHPTLFLPALRRSHIASAKLSNC
jgi:hypothetical protein